MSHDIDGKITVRHKCIPGCGTYTKRFSKMIKVADLPSGCRIYVEKSEAGGRRYWSDAIGGGVMIHDTTLCSKMEIMAALSAEEDFAYLDAMEKRSKMRQSE